MEFPPAILHNPPPEHAGTEPEVLEREFALDGIYRPTAVAVPSLPSMVTGNQPDLHQVELGRAKGPICRPSGSLGTGSPAVPQASADDPVSATRVPPEDT